MLEGENKEVVMVMENMLVEFDLIDNIGGDVERMVEVGERREE